MIKILFFLSKTDESLIRFCTPNTRNIQAALGFFVLLTGIMAFISGSYAISNLFIYESASTGKPEMMTGGGIISILLGIIYAVLIMAIDREIVAASSKYAVIARIPLAVIISMIISLPVEIQLFESRINKKLLSDIQKENKDARSEAEQPVLKLEAERDTILLRKNTAIRERSEWARIMEAEIVGLPINGKTTGKGGEGPAYRQAMFNHIQQDSLIARCDRELSVVDDQLSLLRNKTDSVYKNRRVAQSYDLLSKYIALKEVRRDDTTGAASRMAYGITVLFLLFELIPSLVKLMLPRTEYDILLEKRRQLNILSAKTIYIDATEEYEGKSADEIKENNHKKVRLLVESQAID
jgi:hypothetical protein